MDNKAVAKKLVTIAKEITSDERDILDDAFQKIKDARNSFQAAIIELDTVRKNLDDEFEITEHRGLSSSRDDIQKVQKDVIKRMNALKTVMDRITNIKRDMPII